MSNFFFKFSKFPTQSMLMKHVVPEQYIPCLMLTKELRLCEKIKN